MAVALRHTEDYAVETPAGSIGRVEAVWPEGLAVLTTDGTHALLRGRDVITVDRERRWVVVEEHPGLLELSTGGTVFPEPVDRLAGLRDFLHRHAVHVADRPLWQLVTILYGAVSLIVLFGVALVFLIAWVATGSPY
jgi:hypothetical protein